MNPIITSQQVLGGSFFSAELPGSHLKCFTGSCHHCQHMKKCMNAVN
jgi:hypothetical protein